MPKTVVAVEDVDVTELDFTITKRADFLVRFFLVWCVGVLAVDGGFAVESESKPWKAEPGKSSGWGGKANRLSRQADAVKPEICFVGDSLTEFWSNEGSPVWLLEFHDKKVANLGMAADRVENILWRLKNGGLEKIQPGLVVLMLGTNNLSKSPPDKPEDVARGVAAVLKVIQLKLPRSRVLLLSILPNGYDQSSALRGSVRLTNQALSELEVMGKIDFLNVHDSFLTTAGTWKRGLTVDGTHLTMRGYDVLMNQLRKPLAEVVK
ncbi:MAG: GDSL-type esterase/lipase family protein [Verrucomicrobiota bacterium]